MPTGRMETDRPERYIKQLASHWRDKATVEFDADGATRLAMHSGAVARLRPVDGAVLIETESGEFGEVVARHLERFGAGENLSVSWEE